MSKDFNEVLNELKDDRVPLTSDTLSGISDMNRRRLEAFQEVWSQISPDRRREIVKALIDLTENSVEFDFGEVFRLSLDDGDAEIRSQAIYGLWEDDDPGLVGPFLSMLRHDREEQVREQASEALGQFLLLGELGDLDSPLAFAIQEALLEVYSNSQESVALRCRALESVAYSGDEVVSDLIESAYKGEDEQLTYSALFAMGRSADTRWQTIVMRELGNAKPEFRFEAAQACGKLELAEAVHALGEIAQTDQDPEVRRIAIWALGQIGDVEARRIVGAMLDEQDEDGEGSEFIRDALEEAQEELAFREDALDISFSGHDWLDEWVEVGDDFEDDEDNGSGGH